MILTVIIKDRNYSTSECNCGSFKGWKTFLRSGASSKCFHSFWNVIREEIKSDDYILVIRLDNLCLRIQLKAPQGIVCFRTCCARSISYEQA